MSTTRRALLARTTLAAPAVALPTLAQAAALLPTVPALASPAPAADPVAELGREIHQLWERHRALEERAFASPEPLRSQLLEEAREFDDHLAELEAKVPTMRATSLEGALFQVMLAFCDADTAESYSTQRFSKPYLERVMGSLYSAAMAIERALGVSRLELYGDHYLSPKFDPHLTETAVAGAGAAA